MTTTTYEIVKAAMLKRRPVRATYHGRPRVLCPHVLGASGDEERALFLQTGGESASGAVAADGSWRLMRLDRLELPSIVEDGEWRTAAGFRGYVDMIDEVEVDLVTLPDPAKQAQAPRPAPALPAVAVAAPEAKAEPPCAIYLDYLGLVLRLAEQRLEWRDRVQEDEDEASYSFFRSERFTADRARRREAWQKRVGAAAAAVEAERAAGRWDDEPLGRLARQHGLDAADEAILVYLTLHQPKRGGSDWFRPKTKRGRMPSVKGDVLMAVMATSRTERLAATIRLYADAPLRTSGLVKATGGSEGSPASMDFTVASALARELLGHGTGAKVTASDDDDEDEGLVRRLTPRFRLADVVLGAAEREKIDLSLAPLRAGSTVPKDWGLGAKIKYGKGVGFVFAGPPGTGKTLCAEAIAGELGRPLLVVQVPELMGMFVGETQKHIAEVFERAKDEEGGAVLFFDEADSLFFERSTATRSWEVQDVNVLLTEIERHEGVVVLATNRKDTLDGALTRRVSAVIDFPMPDAAARADIWRKLLPPQERLADDVDAAGIGRAAVLSGGEIKNAVLYAVRLASHRELAKLDQALLVEAAETMAKARWGEATRRRAGFAGR